LMYQIKWCKDNDVKSLVISDKLDGVSIYTKYVDGILVLASTRGNGYEGKDITDKITLIQPTIDKMGIVELRGEAVMTADNCDKLGYSLPRSAVAGILNADDKEHYDKCEFIDIVFYSVLGDGTLKTYTDHFISLSTCGVVSAEYSVINISDTLENEIAEYFKNRKEINIFDIDGIVVANIDDPSVGDDYYPSNMVAFKVNEEAVRVCVTGVEWNIKRSGKLQPVVHFHTTNINGSKISKATGFNKKFIDDNNIHKGSEIGIVKSGDIIPYITECYTRFDGGDIEIPLICPSCNTPLTETETSVDLVCLNIDHCPDQQLYNIEHFLLAHEVEEITATTIKRLRVMNIQDLYSLTDFDISCIDGMGIKRAQTILSQLQKTLKTTPEKLLKSFGIGGIGNTASDLIINHFGDFESLFDKNVDDFIELDGIGDVLALNLVNGLIKNKPLYDFLKQKGLVFDEKASADLQGKIFTLTGKSDINRNDLTKMIVSHGGMVKGISKKVSFLVTNDVDSQSGKAKKARQYGIDIITYDDLLNIIE